MSADFSSTRTIDLSASPDFSIGGIQVRPSLREVRSGDQTERLEPRVMQALVALTSRPGEVVSREAMLDQCWDGRIVGDDAVSRCIAKVRRVGETYEAFKVEVIPRVGYRLILVPGISSVESPAPQRKGRGLLIGIVASALAAAVAISVWLVWPAPLDARTPFVVTDFTSTSTDERLKTFARATVSEINVALARHQLPTGRTGGTRLEFSGFITSDAGRTRAVVSLIALPSSTIIWSADFDRAADEEPQLRAEIASRVAAIAQMVNEYLEYPSPDFDAVTLSLMIKGVDSVQTTSWSSLNAAEEAARRSPRYAAAHANLASGLVSASVFGPPENAEHLRQRAIDEANLARKLEPRTLGTTALVWTMDTRDWAGRFEATSEPPFSENNYGKHARGALLVMAGRVKEGLIPLMAALEGFGARGGRERVLIFAVRAEGKAESALERARRALSLRPSDQGLRVAVLDLVTLWGDPAEAIAILDDFDRRPSDPTIWFDAYRSFARWRTTGAAADRLAAGRAVAAAAKSGMPADSTVPMMARLGDIDGAFALANAWAADPATRYSAMRYNSSFLFYAETKSMRLDPRFVSLAEKIGLLKFWRDSDAWPDFCRTESQSVCGLMRRS